MPLLERWQRFWFAPIAPHAYALLRILFGALGSATLIGLRDVSTFWAIDGLVPSRSEGQGLKAMLIAYGMGDVAGPLVYLFCLISFMAMTVGLRSGVTVALSLAASLLQLSWNSLPLSASNAVVQGVLFCLIWADCGSVWSIDAWLERRRLHGARDESPTYPIAPLRLIRFQIALVYLSSGLWKLYSPLWRDGSALHYVLNNNVFHRFPNAPPPSLEWLLTLGTYITLFWEIGFAFMVLFRPTRIFALGMGVLIHLGMMTAIEVGPFSLVMLAGYVAFLDPALIPTLPVRVFALLRRSESRVSRSVSAAEAMPDQRAAHR